MRLIIEPRSSTEICWLECTPEERAELEAMAKTKGSAVLTTAARDAYEFRRMLDRLTLAQLLPEDWDAPRQPTTQDRLYDIPIKLRWA